MADGLGNLLIVFKVDALWVLSDKLYKHTYLFVGIGHGAEVLVDDPQAVLIVLLIDSEPPLKAITISWY